MARLVLNRRWTFILALGLSVLCCALAHHRAYASGERNSTAGDVIVDPGDGGGGGGAGAGDPDAPVGNGKSGPGSGGMVGGGYGFGGSVGSVGGPPSSVWMWRLRVVVLSLRSFYFRF